MADDREPIEPAAIEWAYLDPDVEALDPTAPTAPDDEALSELQGASPFRRGPVVSFDYGEWAQTNHGWEAKYTQGLGALIRLDHLGGFNPFLCLLGLSVELEIYCKTLEEAQARCDEEARSVEEWVLEITEAAE